MQSPIDIDRGKAEEDSDLKPITMQMGGMTLDATNYTVENNGHSGELKLSIMMNFLLFLSKKLVPTGNKFESCHCK